MSTYRDAIDNYSGRTAAEISETIEQFDAQPSMNAKKRGLLLAVAAALALTSLGMTLALGYQMIRDVRG